MKTFKILSALLTYPTEELKAAADEFPAVLEEEGMLKEPHRRALLPLIRQFAERDLLDLQERYVLLFDRTRSLSLHLFEHVHGESRDRGQAMVDLGQLYHRHGLELDGVELPDFLPIFLEFLSILPPQEARDHLKQPAHILAALGARLSRRKSPYAAVFLALEALAGGRPDREALNLLLAEAEDDPNDGAALDRVWEEEQVTFGPGSGKDGNCPKAADLLARMAELDRGSGPRA